MINSKIKLTDFLDRYLIVPCLLIPFLVPSLNIYNDFILKVYVICVIGLYSWIRFIFKKKYQLLDIKYTYTSAVICLLLLVNIVLNHSNYSLFGGINIQVGSVGLLSVIGIALNSINQPKKDLLIGLFLSCVMLSLFSIYFQHRVYGTVNSARFIGPFFQSDVLAVYLGAGLISGISLFFKNKSINKNILLIIGELIILSGIIFTQTRLIIMLVFLLLMIYLLMRSNRSFKIYIPIFLICIVSISAVVSVSNRSYSPHNLFNSVAYRLDLQYSAIKNSSSSFLIGRGSEGITKDLSCRNMEDFYPLKQTCKNYIFLSTHNVYLDDSILFGYLVGILFLLISIYSIYKSIKAGNNDSLVVGLILSLITIYYFSNVNSIELELIFWLLVSKTIITKKNESLS